MKKMFVSARADSLHHLVMKSAQPAHHDATRVLQLAQCVIVMSPPMRNCKAGKKQSFVLLW